jgi:hypothetical protein
MPDLTGKLCLDGKHKINKAFTQGNGPIRPQAWGQGFPDVGQAPVSEHRPATWSRRFSEQWRVAAHAQAATVPAGLKISIFILVNDNIKI